MSEESAPSSTCRACKERQDEVEKLRRELAEWRQRCQEAEAASQRAREDLRALEGEMEEMQDNFKEEESEQFEQVKQELDAALKNCKILQIRLQKSERQYGQLEQVKRMLEKQLNETGQQREERANNEGSSGARQQQQQQSSALCEVSGEHVKVPTSEYDQLLRDLTDTSERERDLQEQIKYSQEEAQLKGERLQAIEAENEVLLGRINKLTLANSSLRSSLLSSSAGAQQNERAADELSAGDKVRELCEQNEQLKLALEVAQSECERLRQRLAEAERLLEARDRSLRESESKLAVLAGEAAREQVGANSPTSARLGDELRQMRARLARSERECRQLRSQLELLTSNSDGSSQRRSTLLDVAGPRSQSLELGSPAGASCSSTKCVELERQCRALVERNTQLETKVQRLIKFSSQDLDQKSSLESDLFEKLKRQLETSESELAKAKSRLVELDIECGRAQRQYKRLLSSLESCNSTGADFQLLNRNRLAPESARDTLSRAELRQAVRGLESDVDELCAQLRARESLIKELRAQAPAADMQTAAEQLKSLRRLLDQEQLLSNNLKLDVANLEQDNSELAARRQLLERERLAMEEELDKLRQLTGELRAELEESEREKQLAQDKARELGESLERLRVDLNQARQVAHEVNSSQAKEATSRAGGGDSTSSTDLLLMARDLSELKVKNGFLMRQLELARDDASRQLDELRAASEAQQRRTVELARLELKERHLQATQAVRDELNECKQRLAQLQRQLARQDEEAAGERERVRGLEREWRRERGQWQQAREQLEAQLALEKRSSEFRLKEAEAASRDKERQLISVQDRCVQLERDLKRAQNKYRLLEEDSESKLKRTTRDLELKAKELAELSGKWQARNEQQFELTKRLADEKAALKEALESARRSHDERAVEARQLREVLAARQEQSYKERAQHFEQLEGLTKQLEELRERETQAKLLKQRLEVNERQLESCRRDLAQLREERTRLRTRCEELEKHELITKTSTISGQLAPSHSSSITGSPALFKPFGSPRSQLLGSARDSAPAHSQAAGRDSRPAPAAEQSVCERLSGKINDQRNLINILKQQLTETQLELRQLKLLQASERTKWQSRVALLTARLNECEEKLALETSLLSASGSLVEHFVRPRLDASWARERQASQELIQQQQTQIELLARDLKRTSDSHQLLRLQARQLESQNGKLSRKLIEHQQQSSISSLQDKQLEQSRAQLLANHIKLSRETRALLEIVGKIVASLDAPEQTAASAPRPRLDSTERPLRAGESRRSLDTHADEFLDLPAQPPVRQSRLTRLLAGGTQANSAAAQTKRTQAGAVPADSMPAQQKATTKRPVKRVRVKCSTLGITTTEKKQLKVHLKSLGEALEAAARLELNSSERVGRGQLSSHSNGPSGTNRQEALDSDQSHSSRVHWQLDSEQLQRDSDLESESSLSLAADRTADAYRRFPQANPASRGNSVGPPPTTAPVGHASLTDYESESSLASDYSVSAFGARRLTFGLPSGAESDSALAGKSATGSRGRKKSSAGLRGRLTSTLRHISRSITGGLGGGDAEPETPSTSRARAKARADLKEIRV